jgi:hypothetical protein
MLFYPKFPISRPCRYAAQLVTMTEGTGDFLCPTGEEAKLIECHYKRHGSAQKNAQPQKQFAHQN